MNAETCSFGGSRMAKDEFFSNVSQRKLVQWGIGYMIVEEVEHHRW